MAGKLVQVATNTVTSAVSSVTLTGIDSDDVYMVAVNNFDVDTDAVTSKLRVTVSGSADSTSNYDQSAKILFANTSFSTSSGTNLDRIDFYLQGTGIGEQSNFIFYLYNFNNSSEYSFATVESSAVDSFARNLGRQGGFVHTVAQACNGVQFFLSSGNIASGTFTLFKVV
jgi:hypothetical protein